MWPYTIPLSRLNAIGIRYNLFLIRALSSPKNSFADSKMFWNKREHTKLSDDILEELRVKTKTQCAMYCYLDNACTRFSYHGDALSNNCFLGSFASGEITDDNWTTYSV